MMDGENHNRVNDAARVIPWKATSKRGYMARFVADDRACELLLRSPPLGQEYIQGIKNLLATHDSTACPESQADQN
jgi:hypothetical protein